MAVLSALGSDLRFALRSLRASPRFTAAAVVTLALGIGANAAIFSVVDRMVLNPFPAIDHPDRVVWLFESGGKLDLARDGVAAANFVDWKAQSKSIESWGALRLEELTLTGSGEPERVGGQAVTPGYFAVMGLKPVIGRFFTDGEEKAQVAVMGHGLWQRRWGGDPNVLGSTVEINGRATTIVGILPPAFVFPRAPDLVVPLDVPPEVWQDRKEGAFAAMGRLRPGVSVDEAAAELEVIAQRLAAAHPDTNTDLGVNPVPLGQVFSVRGPVVVLLLGVGFLLLIACGNVANLQLARGAARRRELAVRQALGAGRGRIVRQLLVETLVISVAGAALGLVLAVAGVDLLVASFPASMTERIPILRMLSVNGTVLGYSVGLAVACTLLAGLAPALQGARVDLTSSLKEGAQTGRSRRRLMGALVVAQLAMAVLLLASSSVLLRSYLAQRSRPVGFRPDGVFTLRLPLATRHPETADRLRFTAQLLDRLGGLGQVAVTSAIPSTDNMVFPFTVTGEPPPPRAEQPVAHGHWVSGGIFGVLELPLRGRTFTAADAGRPVVIVSDSIARRWLAGRDPIGARLDLDGTSTEIIGVAGDVPSSNPRSNATGTMYFPYDGDFPRVIVTLRAADPVALGALARAAVRELDPRQVIEAPLLLDRILSDHAANDRMLVWLTGVTSSIALILAALGIYGLVAYGVSQRTREIGIRMALGARGASVMLTVLRQVAILGAIGLVVGLGLTIPLVGVLRGIFYLPGGAGVPLVLASLFIVAVSALAGVLPALRALRVDPMIALRAE